MTIREESYQKSPDGGNKKVKQVHQRKMIYPNYKETMCGDISWTTKSMSPQIMH